MNRRRWFLLVLLVILSGGGYLYADWYRCLPEGRTANFVGVSKCAECHTGQQKLWKGSHHEEAMALATKESVLGNFENATYEQFGITSRMFRDGDKFLVETEGKTPGKLETFPVKYTFGVSPLQQYMVEFADGRVQVLPLCWDVKKKEWFHIYPNEPIKPGDPLHWTGFAQTWNHMCAECHSTDVHKNYDVDKNEYHTSFAEINVSCESCHGPGSLHVEIAEQKKVFWDRRYGYGLPNLKEKDLKTGRFQTEMATCAKCHARHDVIHAGFSPGNDYYDNYSPTLLDGMVYHPDGQLLDEAYEWGSFQQSHMFRKGVHCIDCHDPHTAKLKAEGNNLCNRCHVPAKYDTPAHHHHLADSVGSKCVECHMPTTNYMVVHPRRDHSLRIPRPDLSDKLGTNNACNNCHRHSDKTTQWSADYINQWFGPKRRDVPHYGEVIQKGREARKDADLSLAKLLKSPDVGPMVRASALSLLRNLDRPETMQAIEAALHDPEPIVRASAVARVPEKLAQTLAVPLLKDPVRLVRHEAFSSLVRTRISGLSPDEVQAFKSCYQEFVTGLESSLDTPGANLSLAHFFGSQQDLPKAEFHFQQALKLDPSNIQARRGLAQLFTQQNQPEVAEAICRDAIRLGRDVIETQNKLIAQFKALNQTRDVARATQECEAFKLDLAASLKQLGVTLGSQKDHREKGIESLKEAVTLSPLDAEIRILCAEVMQATDHETDAVELLKAGLKLTPDEPEIAAMLADALLRAKDVKGARGVLSEACKYHADDTRLLARWTKIEMAEKNWAIAAKLAERWLEQDSQNREAIQAYETSLRNVQK